MYKFESLNKLTKKYLSEEEIKRLRHVYLIAREAHEGQARSSGEPYITHPIAVACILAKMKLDHETLMAALLHDVIEDTPATYQDMEQLFGKSIAELVEGVSKLDNLQFRDKKEAQAENFQKMIMAMVQDIRVILIKLADRTHNMRTLESLRPDKKRRIALETLEIYSPLAHRLGIYHLKTELEELGFKALYPKRFRVINQLVKISQCNRREMIQNIIFEITNRLQGAGIECHVNGREKHLYAIYCKMHLKTQCFHSIVNDYSFQIIVRDLDNCYRVLGELHNLYKPLPGHVKDYIAVPKRNGYQSLHTSLIGPRGLLIKIQIYTEDMEQMAKMGVAAHWTYKDIGLYSTIQIRSQRLLKNLIELYQNTGNSFEFIESVKSELLPNEIYVFTPKGHIIELPAGSTSVDFAYAVHSNIGHTCIGARLNHRFHPLSQRLTSGQTVEIITAPDARPNPNWLNFVVSSKAKTKIRQLIKIIKYDNSVNIKYDVLRNTCYDNKKSIKIGTYNIKYRKSIISKNFFDIMQYLYLKHITKSMLETKILYVSNKILLHIKYELKKIFIKFYNRLLVNLVKNYLFIINKSIIIYMNLDKFFFSSSKILL
ncbi:RelA/SpoT family protein [Pantoea sp. Mhis]|nr:RelA/SpoT family protein [Pantoea sp. Mhis]